MGLSEAAFREALPALHARGFPEPDSTTGNFDLDAIDAWRQGRHTHLWPSVRGNGSARVRRSDGAALVVLSSAVGPPVEAPRHYPPGSIGEGYQRYKATQTWAAKAPRTREDWERGYARIDPYFGNLASTSVNLETIDRFYNDPQTGLVATVGIREAHRVIKIWRALWRVLSAMGYSERDADPSLAIRRRTPAPRAYVWREGEIVRLVKHAIRRGYPGLACVIAVSWDTQLSPADVRKLAPTHVVEEGGRLHFRVDRSKTGAAALGTICARTDRVVKRYLATIRAPSAVPLFRNRSGNPYSKDTLGDDFRKIRGEVFPGDPRTIGHDMRRSGTQEAFAGGADPNAVAAKMANTINSSRELQRTYNPVSRAAIAQADEARRRGRRAIRDN
jgi:hypothetical protein